MPPIETPICNFGEKAKDFCLKSVENKKISLENMFKSAEKQGEITTIVRKTRKIITNRKENQSKMAPRRQERQTKIIPNRWFLIGLLLMSYWFLIGFLLISYRFLVYFLLVFILTLPCYYPLIL